jgi:hypothetical protein
VGHSHRCPDSFRHHVLSAPSDGPTRGEGRRRRAAQPRLGHPGRGPSSQRDRGVEDDPPTIAHLRWLARRVSIPDALASARGADGRTLIRPEVAHDGSIIPIHLPAEGT